MLQCLADRTGQMHEQPAMCFSPVLKGPPAGGVTLNSVAGTSHRPGAPIFTLTMLEVMYWMPTLRGEMSGPNCGRVESALLRLPVWADPVCVSAL